MRTSFRKWSRVVAACGMLAFAIAAAGYGVDWYGMTTYTTDWYGMT